MCGIDGIIANTDLISLEEYYKRHSLLSHRGPDGEGFLIRHNGKFVPCSGNKSPNIIKEKYPHILKDRVASLVLGHHRLSIIDLSEAGHQPISCADQRFWMVYNGEVYNYVELRNELANKGWRFRSKTDSEVVLCAFAEWGAESFNLFNGMWALAIYDTFEEKLYLSRDRFGIKPLFYAITSQALIFGSEAKFIIPFLDNIEIDEEVSVDYIAAGMTDHRPETMVRGLMALEPGHFATYKNGRMEISRYWEYVPEIDESLSYEQALGEFDELFSSAIDLRMRSDVPVGSLLSGGLDSTSIVCNLHHRDVIPNPPLHTFTAVFDEQSFSEKEYVEDTALKLKNCIKPHYIHPASKDFDEEFDKLMFFNDFPVCGLTVMSQFRIYSQIRSLSPVVVLLNGQGADELFGGYTGHYYSLIFGHMLSGKIFRGYNELSIMSELRDLKKTTILTKVAKRIIKKICFDINVMKPTIKNSYLIRDYPSVVFDKLEDPFQNELYCNLCYSSLREYLRYEDRMSMSASMESRLPFLDYRLVEWAFRLPNDFKVKLGVNKKIVRDSVKSYITPSVLTRRDKMGFVFPQDQWQKTLIKDLMTDVIYDNGTEMPFLHEGKLRVGYDKYLEGSDNGWGFWWRVFNYKYWFNNINRTVAVKGIK